MTTQDTMASPSAPSTTQTLETNKMVAHFHDALPITAAAFIDDFGELVYLHHDSGDFVFDLEMARQHLHIATPHFAKSLVYSRFEVGKAFVDAFSTHGCTTMLTFDTFRTVSKLVDTDVGRCVSEHLRIMEREMNIQVILDNLRSAQVKTRGIPEHFDSIIEPSSLGDNVYINKAAVELHCDVHKIGNTINPKTREATFNTPHNGGTKMLFIQPTSNGPLLEKVVAHILKPFNTKVKGRLAGVEHYDGKLEHSLAVIGASGVVIEALRQCDQSWSLEETVQVVKLELDLFVQRTSNQNNAEPLVTQSVKRCKRDDKPRQHTSPFDHQAPSSFLEDFMAMGDSKRLCRITFRRGAMTDVQAFKAAFKVAMKENGMSSVWRQGDEDRLHKYGVTVSRKRRDYMCLSCDKLSHKGCCALYSQQNRRQKTWFYGLSLETLQTTVPDTL